LSSDYPVKEAIPGMPERIHMPIKANPFKHQRDAYDFACGLFGLSEGGDGRPISIQEFVGSLRKCPGCAFLMEMG